MILVTIDRVEVVELKPWEQRKDGVPDSLFIGCEVFEEPLRAHPKRWDLRRRLSKDDMMSVDGSGLPCQLDNTATPARTCNNKIH